LKIRSLTLMTGLAMAASSCDSGTANRAGAEPTTSVAKTQAGRILSLDGEPIDPFANLQSRPVVLLFVRTDCPISNRYAPEMRRLMREFGQFKFWLVYPDADSKAETIRGHLKEFELDVEALRDPDHVLVRLANARVTPEAAVFDVQRRLVYRGRIDDRFVSFGETRPVATTHELQEVLSAMAAGKKPATLPAPAIGCTIGPNS
jgi:hypothetical protein